MRRGAPDPFLGQVVSGFRIERLLGRGGMGAVYLAQRPDGSAAVVKVLAPEVAENPSLRKRFQREGLALQKVRAHPNVVRVHEVSDAETPFIIMEYVDGGSLTDLLGHRGRLAPREAARIARDVALGLVVIHSQGLVHRDIKPANVLLETSGRAKIVDLGLAKDVFMSGLTAPGQLMGTVSYMAPEQWGAESSAADARSDVFALGATLYHLVTGKPPFSGEDLAEIADLAQAGAFDRPRDLLPGFPADLELIITQMLMPDPERRYGSAEGCAEDLDGFLAGRPAHVPALQGEGSRYPLLVGRRFTLGSADSCDIVVPNSSPKHARIAHKAKGYVLSNLRSSSGTWVGETQLSGPVTLADGDSVRLGQVQLTFVDPQSRPLEPPYLRDVRRQTAPPPVAELLARQRDARAVLYLLGRLTPDPIVERGVARAIGTLLGPQVLSAVQQRRANAEHQARSWIPSALAAISGDAATKTPEGWLLWWDMVRTSYPTQILPGGPLPQAWLEAGAGAHPDLPLGDRGLTRIGRDERCALRLRAGPRLHACVLRLHSRWIVRDEASPTGTLKNGAKIHLTWFDPGDTLTLDGLQLRLRVAEPELRSDPQRRALIDPTAFEALEELRHPSVAAGLVAFMRAATDLGWVREQAAALCPGSEGPFAEALAATYAERARRGRQLLPQILGQDAGDDPAAWSSLLAANAARLGPQVVPAGWLR